MILPEKKKYWNRFSCCCCFLLHVKSKSRERWTIFWIRYYTFRAYIKWRMLTLMFRDELVRGTYFDSAWCVNCVMLQNSKILNMNLNFYEFNVKKKNLNFRKHFLFSHSTCQFSTRSRWRRKKRKNKKWTKQIIINITVILLD